MSPCTRYGHHGKEERSKPKADDRLDQRALSGAVGAEENVCFPRVNAQVDSLEHFLAGDFNMEINNVQNRLYASHVRRSAYAPSQLQKQNELLFFVETIGRS